MIVMNEAMRSGLSEFCTTLASPISVGLVMCIKVVVASSFRRCRVGQRVLAVSETPTSTLSVINLHCAFQFPGHDHV